jgi:ketosteroid isomerase-like protein
METFKKTVDELNSMVSQGKLLEAFDLYYADDVVMQENETAPRVGKAANRTVEEGFVNGLTAFSATPTAVGIGDNVSVVEWYYDFNHKEWGPQKKNQVSVQHWKDGKIVKEKFYYDTAKH